MIRYHASWVVPIEGEPIKDGWVMVDGAVLPRSAARRQGHDEGRRARRRRGDAGPRQRAYT
jgi:hypothetical protein